MVEVTVSPVPATPGRLTRRPGSGNPGAMSTVPPLAGDALRVRWPGRATAVLERVDVSLPAGTVSGILGYSGTGKSTVLATLCGLVPWHRPAEVAGTVRVGGDPVDDLDPGQRAHLVATVLDRPESQLFLPTPRDEIETAQRLHGHSPIAARVIEALELGRFMDRPSVTLSSGERQRVALALGLLAGPRPVLLDEPTSHLDPEGCRVLDELLCLLARDGGCALLAEQSGWRLPRGVGGWHRLQHGRLGPAPQPQPPAFPPPSATPGPPVLQATDLEVRRGGRTLLEDASLVLRRGEVVLLTGPNGSGKSTLARVLAGVERPARGSVHRCGRAALMLPDATLQLFHTSVAEEAESTGAPGEAVARVLRRHRLQSLAARAPWSLSRGEQQRLVHAVLDLLRPDVMILDEPGQGLDPRSLADLLHLVHRRAEHGRAYLIISHREELATAVHRRLELRNGRLVEAA